MQRTVASFALATLSLLVSYAIVAAWPGPPDEPVVAETAPVAAQTAETALGFTN
jgi:hypothetical protein